MLTSDLHLLAAWTSILLGVLSGAVIGLYFHREGWAGGYSSFRRRLLRLGHISFFGLGLINLSFGLTLGAVSLAPVCVQVASFGFLVGLITMPLCCFLAAWRSFFRHLFPIPVVGVLVGTIAVLAGWSTG
jgi:hypothetical protein